MSNEQKKYINKYRFNKLLILFIQFIIVILFIGLWEYLSNNNIINSFIFSSPSKVIKTICDLYKSNELFKHIFIYIFLLFIRQYYLTPYILNQNNN